MDDDFTEYDFLRDFIRSVKQIVWFLGAGASRTAGMPAATDVIWDLKLKYYCLHENQNIQRYDIHNKEIKARIQTYFDSKDYPVNGSVEEYSFYFDLMFGKDYAAQQKYIRDTFSSDKISLNIGHRALAAMLEMGITRIVFTTNFDEVIETAYSSVADKSLSPFHLEGSYAALEALNAEQFPIYAKIHGDFRYQSIKNLPRDLISNDQEIQKCFLAASSRYGLIVTGYSGRDENVMSMFKHALGQNNAFPQGLFWTTPKISDVSNSVKSLIKLARTKGVNAHIVETGTFDIMLSKLWRQIPDKPMNLELKVHTAKARPVCIPLPAQGDRFPILRTNALAITEYPSQCACLDYNDAITFKELNEIIKEHKPEAILSYTDHILFWGDTKEICNIFDNKKVKDIRDYKFEDPITLITKSGIIKSFFEQALAHALCNDKPLLIRRKNNTYYIIVEQKCANDPVLQPLKDVLQHLGKPVYLTGSVPKKSDTFWAEALSLKLEERNGLLWLLIRPDIWISPLSMRINTFDFLRFKKIYRYNSLSYDLLDAWIKILFGEIGTGKEVSVTCLPNANYAAKFKISTRTAYSYGG